MSIESVDKTPPGWVSYGSVIRILVEHLFAKVPSIGALLKSHSVSLYSSILLPFTFSPLVIPDVILVEAKSFADEHGFSAKTYRTDEFCDNGIETTFVEDNHSRSELGLLRGLHFQKDPHAQVKLGKNCVWLPTW